LSWSKVESVCGCFSQGSPKLGKIKIEELHAGKKFHAKSAKETKGATRAPKRTKSENGL